MRKILLALTSILFMAGLLTGCSTTLKEYEPKSAAEKAVHAVIIQWETSYETKDIPSILAIFHEDAKITFGATRLTGSKQEYKDYITSDWGADDYTKTWQLIGFQAEINENKAVVQSNIKLSKAKLSVTFELVKENGEWLIISNKY